MLAFIGFTMAAQVTGKNPLAALREHLDNPLGERRCCLGWVAARFGATGGLKWHHGQHPAMRGVQVCRLCMCADEEE